MFNFTSKKFSKSLHSFTTFLKKMKYLKIDAVEEDPKTGLLYLLVSFCLKSALPMKKDPYQLLMENGEKISTYFTANDFKKIVDTIHRMHTLTVKKYSTLKNK